MTSQPAPTTTLLQSAWTTDTLFMHMTEMLRQLDLRVEQHNVDSRRATDLALSAQQLTVTQSSDTLRLLIAAEESNQIAALLALKELVSSNFAALDKAVNKSEQAQSDYNHRSNEFRAALDDQAKLQQPRTEADVQYNALGGRIEVLRSSTEATVDAIKVAFDDRVEQINKRLAAVDLALAGMLTIASFDARHAVLQNEVNSLHDVQNSNLGREKQATSTTARDQWIIGIAIGLPGLLLGIVELARLMKGV